jgi:DNA-directed RNA polymerase subunit L
MNSIEECNNVIELLKQVLKFYADKSNYDAKHPVNNVLFSHIEMDCGAQARFVLERVDELENLTKNLEDKFVKNVTKAIENGEEVDKIMGMIEDFKKINETMDDIGNNIKQNLDD